jgi:Flp pilus assembly protein TadG
MRRLNRERGSQTLEFTIIGIPLTFLLFSIANMCFSMLTLHTMQEAVEQGARYASTRGSTCSSTGNSCTVKIQQIADVIASAAAGINPAGIKVTFTPPTGGTTVTCSNLSTCTTVCSPSCDGHRTLVWPDGVNNGPPNDIQISADCTLNAPMFMFWTGASGSTKINNTTFHAYSTQRLMF